MNYIFHTITICFILLEVVWLINPKKQVASTKKYLEESKKHKGKKWDSHPEYYKDLMIQKGCSSLVAISWMFIGLLTFNWVAFLGLIIFNILIVAPLSKVTKYSASYVILHWCNSLIGFSVAIFILINSFHLKINLYELFLKQL